MVDTRLVESSVIETGQEMRILTNVVMASRKREKEHGHKELPIVVGRAIAFQAAHDRKLASSPR